MLCFHRWFHGKIPRQKAEEILKPRENGLFLVRESTNYPGDYTMCVCYEQKVEHYRVLFRNNKLTIDEEEYFENLSKLVEVSILSYKSSTLVLTCYYYYQNHSKSSEMFLINIYIIIYSL